MGTDLDELEIYRSAERLAGIVWEIVSPWKEFERQTMGSQLVRAADSVGANIAEAHGRYHFGEKLQFLYYARGSLYETRHWLRLAYRRGLLQNVDTESLGQHIEGLAIGLNRFAGSIKSQRTATKLKETPVRYDVHDPISTLSISNELEFITKEDLSWLSNVNES